MKIIFDFMINFINLKIFLLNINRLNKKYKKTYNF